MQITKMKESSSVETLVNSSLETNESSDSCIKFSTRFVENLEMTLSESRAHTTDVLPSLPRVKSANRLQLPVEIWVHILRRTDLKKCRLLNKKFLTLSNDVLLEVYAPFVDQLEAIYGSACVLHDQLKSIKTPQLDHFKQFLLSPNTMENLNEITWYTNAQVEVQSVCECLIRLFGAFPDHDSTTRVSWIEMRRILKRSDFKLWVQNMAVNVEFIDFKDTKKVEQIIRVDPLITYERLREVSMAGYRLLILVAASLQYSTISNELEVSQGECDEIQKKLDLATKFLECL